MTALAFVVGNMRLLELAPLISATAFVFSAIMVTLQLRNVHRDRFVIITNALFETWQSPDFMKAQLWIIHEMSEKSWQEFQDHHGNKEGEAALLRVAGFYNRVGTLIHLSLVDGRSILRTIGGTACAVWRKTEPLVEGARRENPAFLLDFERLLPHCKACGNDVA